MDENNEENQLTVPVDHVYKAVIRMTKQRDRIKYLEAQLKRKNETLVEIANKAHGYSSGPAVPDALWEIKQIAEEAIEEKGTTNEKG